MMPHPTASYLLALQKQRRETDPRQRELRRQLRTPRGPQRAFWPTLWSRIKIALITRSISARRLEPPLVVRSGGLPRRAQFRNDGGFDRRVRDRGVMARVG